MSCIKGEDTIVELDDFSKNNVAFRISVANFVDEIRWHLHFLKQANDTPVLQDRRVLQNAIRRYEHHWLPLVAAQPFAKLVPPLDVAWIWHVHMLAPVEYAKDFARLYPDSTIPQRVLNPERSENYNVSQQTWGQNFPAEPYELDLSYPESLPACKDFKSRIVYDLLDAAQRQITFYYHVSLPHFQDQLFLETAILRYRKFVELKKRYRDAFLVPVYDIDLVWHTHQLHPQEYQDDCRSFLGNVLVHDDTDTDRTPNSKLAAGDALTRQLWQETYGEPYAIPGCMNRGFSTADKLYRINSDLLNIERGKIAYMVLEKLRIEEARFNAKKVKVKVSLFYKDSFGSEFEKILLKMTFPEEQDMTNEGSPQIQISTENKSHRLLLTIRSREGLKSVIGGNDIGKCETTLNRVLEQVPVDVTSAQRDHVVQTTDGSKLVLTFRLTSIKPMPISVKLKEAGQFDTYTNPEKIESLWGPVDLPPLPENASCLIANHKFSSLDDQPMPFTCRIIHSRDLRMSMVQVFYKDKMVVVSHLVGNEQLPYPDQVQPANNLPTLDFRRGERAMLIKNWRGDWCITKGMWADGRTGKPRSKARNPEDPNDPGELKITFKLLVGTSGGSSAHVQSDKLGRVDVNLREEQLSLNPPRLTDFAEHLCMALSVLMLRTLCEPRALTARVAQSSALLRALGYNIQTPSNPWLMKVEGIEELEGVDKDSEAYEDFLLWESANASKCGSGCGARPAFCAAGM